MLPEEQQRDDKNKRNPLNRNSDDKNPRKGSKFSIYWIYAIIAAVLIGMQFFKSDTDVKSTEEGTFRDVMYAGGDVDKIVQVYNRRIVRVFIKKDSLTKSYYQAKLKDKPTLLAKDNKSAQFEFGITDWGAFSKSLEDYRKEKQLPQLIASVENDTEYGPWISNIFFILLLVLSFVMMMRKMGGGGGAGGPGGIFNIGKSRAQIFDKDPESQHYFCRCGWIRRSEGGSNGDSRFLKTP